MPETQLPYLPDVSTFAAPLYLALIALEVFLIRRGRADGRYESRDATTSISMGAGSVVAGLATAFIGTGAAFAAWEWRLFTLDFNVWTFALLFVLFDFKYYWWHRVSHRVRWFWANHVVHHSSQHYNLSTALRQPWTTAFTGLFVLNIPLVLLGFHPLVVAFTSSVNLFYQFWIHTEAIDRMPRWFEAVMNTPSHHRVHHAVNPMYLDANYAGVFIVWDKMFGTFVPERREETIRYGIVHQLDTFNPLRVAFHEWAAIARDLVRPGLRWYERLGYVVAEPGWSHDGTRQSSTDLKAAYVREHPEEAGAPGLPALAATAGARSVAA